MATARRTDARGGILGGPVDPGERLAAQLPQVEAAPGLAILHRASGFLGVVVTLDGDAVVVRGATGLEKRLRNRPGDFAVDGRPVRLVQPRPPAHTPSPPHRMADSPSDSPTRTADPPDSPRHRGDSPSDSAIRENGEARADGGVDLRGGRVSLTERTASGSRAVVGARARVARASRILVEGVHDAELVERVWGDDLRVEGVVVERLDGADHLDGVVGAFAPGPGRRLGVLLDHLVSGTKEARLAAAVRHAHVLVTGTPFVDVWEAVRPAAVGIDAWPSVPMGTPWKDGVCAALGVTDARRFWRHILDSVNDWKDLETPFVSAVERLIDFVTGEDPGR
jgi:hypothetical protein